MKTNLEMFSELMSRVPSTRLSDPRLIQWLITNGFFTQVASGRHHGNHRGGLFAHSLAVTEKLVEYTHDLNLNWQYPDSPYIVGMFHDLCKIDEYETTMIGGTLQITKIKNSDEHGEKSVRYLSRLMPLTGEEKLCIRYHMGPYMINEWNEFDHAIKKYENVLYTHMADMWVSRIKNK